MRYHDSPRIPGEGEGEEERRSHTNKTSSMDRYVEIATDELNMYVDGA